MKPKVDIVITTFNREKILPRAVNSVLAQDYQNLSIIIVDDGSTDNTREYLKQLETEKNIKLIYHQYNKGQTITKNTGLKNLSPDTKYFGFFDSDDIMLPGSISSLVDILEKHGDSISQVYGWCKDIETGKFSGSFDGDGEFVTFEDALCERLKGEHWQLFRKEFLGDLRFDERAAGKLSLVWHGMLKKAPGYMSDIIVRVYDTSYPDRLTLPRFDEVRCTGKMFSNRCYLEHFKNDLLMLCPERYGYLCLETSRWAKLSGHLLLSIKFFFKGVLKVPIYAWIPVALQIVMPMEIVRKLKIRKYSNK